MDDNALVEFMKNFLTGFLSRNDAGRFEHLEMVRNRQPLSAEPSGDVTDVHPAHFAQEKDDVETGRVADGGEQLAYTRPVKHKSRIGQRT